MRATFAPKKIAFTKSTIRRFAGIFAAFAAVTFTTMVLPGTTHAWTNNTSAYNLIQTPSWGNVISTDAAGNSYVAVSVKDTFTIGSVSATVGSNFRYLILKTDRTGAAVWGTAINLDGWGDINGLKADGAGNVFVTAKFSGTATIGSTTLTSAGGTDIAVFKLNTSGAVAWATSFGGTNNDWGCGIGIDGSGNVYVSGGMQGTVAFGSTSLTSAGSNDMFLTKLNASGAAQWATKIGGTGDDNCGWMQGLAVDSAGNSYVTGQIQGSVTVAGNTLTSAGGSDVFVGKVNSSGVWQWGSIGGSASGENSYGVALDGQGGAYVTGVYRGAATFGSSSLTYSGGDDSFVARINGSGVWQWARPMQGTSGEYSVSLDVDSSGSPVVAGYFYSSALTIGSSTLTYAGGGGGDGFAAKWNASGTFQWAVQLGGTDDDGFYGVAVDSDNNVRLTGWAGKSNAVSFNGGTPISIMSGCSNSCWSYVEWTLSSSGGAPSYTTTTSSTTTSTTTSVAPSTTAVTASPSTTVANTTNSVVAPAAASTKSTTATASTVVSTTAVPATSTPETTTTTIAQNQPDDVEVKLGGLAATVDGKPVSTSLRRESNSIIATAGGLTARYGATDTSNNPIPLDADGNLRVKPGQSVTIDLSGSEGGSTGEAWMFSDPVNLGSFEMDDAGKASTSFKIPGSTQNGTHTLLVQTHDAAGHSAEIRLGFAVGEMPKGVSTTNIVIALLLVATLAAVLLPVAFNRRRRTA